ncbi:hypothetical protein [Amaricoccus macauensis]|uniref:hypothetical protein n=1 Tax=Amaricoccus macauensis TaxID=57001 RepID=UPI003C7CA194
MDFAVEDRFYTALSAVISARLGAEHPCAMATANAARSPSSRNVNAAHQELERLDSGIRKEVEQELETWMRGDI